jgi:transcriptional regulator with XRE-family HTH domain
MAQEEFDTVSSRTYVSELERGVRQATVVKIDSIASAMQVHPLTVLTLSYCRTPSALEASTLLARISDEINELAAAAAARR